MAAPSSTPPAKAPSTGKLITTIVLMILLPVILVGAGIGLFAAAVLPLTMTEVPVGQEGTITLEPGDYYVYESDAPTADMTITDPDGRTVPQDSVTGDQRVTVESTEYTAVSEIKIETEGVYTASVEGFGSGVMAIGPSLEDTFIKGLLYIGIASVVAFILFIVLLILAIRMGMKRSRARKAQQAGGPGAGGPPPYTPPGGAPGYAPPPSPGYGPPPAPGGAPNYPPPGPPTPPPGPSTPPPGPSTPPPPPPPPGAYS
jgi:hypothetical protein